MEKFHLLSANEKKILPLKKTYKLDKTELDIPNKPEAILINLSTFQIKLYLLPGSQDYKKSRKYDVKMHNPCKA